MGNVSRFVQPCVYGDDGEEDESFHLHDMKASPSPQGHCTYAVACVRSQSDQLTGSLFELRDENLSSACNLTQPTVNRTCKWNSEFTFLARAIFLALQI